MHVFRFVVFVSIAALLSACASVPTPLTEAAYVPSDRIMLSTDSTDGTAEIIFVRDWGSQGSLCYVTIFLNGVPAAHVARGEQVSFFVDPGQYIFGAKMKRVGLCGAGQSLIERETTIQEGQRRAFRIAIPPGASIDILPTTVVM